MHKWTQGDGTEIDVRDMTDEHLRNSIATCEEKIAALTNNIALIGMRLNTTGIQYSDILIHRMALRRHYRWLSKWRAKHSMLKIEEQRRYDERTKEFPHLMSHSRELMKRYYGKSAAYDSRVLGKFKECSQPFATQAIVGKKFLEVVARVPKGTKHVKFRIVEE